MFENEIFRTIEKWNLKNTRPLSFNLKRSDFQRFDERAAKLITELLYIHVARSKRISILSKKRQRFNFPPLFLFLFFSRGEETATRGTEKLR